MLRLNYYITVKNLFLIKNRKNSALVNQKILSCLSSKLNQDRHCDGKSTIAKSDRMRCPMITPILNLILFALRDHP